MSAVDKIRLAKQASGALAQANTLQKNAALEAIAVSLEANTKAIIEANALDIEAGVSSGLSAGLQDRLTLNEQRISALAQAVRSIAILPDPIGDVAKGMTLPNGLKLTQVAVPFGVVGAIYEARPNVTIDIAALALKAGIKVENVARLEQIAGFKL